MDELNATPGGETPSTADGANVAGAETQVVTQPTETQVQATPETPATEEFSAGWTYGEEEQAEADVELTDEQITELTKDPALDQTKVPGLVQKLRDKFALEKRQKAEISALREQLAQFEQYGGVEGAGQMAGLANGLIRDPQQGSGAFMATLAKQSLPAYQGIADTLVQYEHEYLVSALQRAGKLPEAQQTAGQQLTAEDWGRIPQELHDIAKQIPVNELLNWLDNGNDETLKMMLNTQKELSELKGAQRQQAEQQWRTAVQQAETQGQQAVYDLSNQYEKAHMAQLAKWQPFGPQAGEQNQRLYSMVLNGALNQMLADEQWGNLRREAIQGLEGAPLKRLRGDHLGADADVRNAHAAATRFNVRLGQVMKDMIAHSEYGLNSVFRDARQWREYQRQSAPERKEIPGVSSTASNGHTSDASALDENGNISDGFMARLTERMKGWKG